VGLFALTTMVAFPALAQVTGKISDPRISVKATPEIIVTETHIAILKNVLNLRPEQEAYWIPVQAALGDLARWQAMTASEVASSVAGVKKRLKRIATVAAPLIRALDEDQRRNVMILARTFGFEHLVASF
jgi:hypothetical protein